MNPDDPRAHIDWDRIRALALRRLRAKTSPQLFARARRGTEIEDLVQETVIRLFFALERTQPRNLEAFATDIADKVVIDFVRKGYVDGDRHPPRSTDDEDDAELPDAKASPDVWADRTESLEFLVQEFFEQRGAHECLQLMHHRYDSAKPDWAEIGTKIGKSADAAKQAWSRCLKGVRAAFREQGTPLWQWAVDEGRMVTS